MAMNMQAMAQQIASMSEEQREQLLSRMTPEQRQQAIQMHSAMMDMQHLMGCFAADPQKPDEPYSCLLYTSPSPRDKRQSRMPSSA